MESDVGTMACCWLGSYVGVRFHLEVQFFITALFPNEKSLFFASIVSRIASGIV